MKEFLIRISFNETSAVKVFRDERTFFPLQFLFEMRENVNGDDDQSLFLFF